MTEPRREVDPYAQYETWKQWDREPFGSFTRKQHYYFKKLLTYNFGSNSSSLRLEVLEIGFGNGAFAGWLKATHPKMSWAGVEIQDALVAKAQQAGFNGMSAIPDTAPEEQYDLIAAFDVIEHLSDQDIKSFFAKASVMLKPKGVVLTRTPNAGGPFGLPNQTGDQTHVTPISLSRLGGYLDNWQIEERGDLQPVWEGKFFSAIRNCVRLLLRTLISACVRFAFAPQPKTLLASNLHLTFKLRN